ncbi:hypothetical protein CXF83_07785 [Shewanella sp. Choline-02u-19]|jgi:hypothetical protein|uniref:hypothetical protein n=1 Tax=unclassified Shewanella TaxID=196818 RepID=UPI000C325B69|nr:MULTISPECIES: hypothetical protein [unclassified Shewanella]PKG58308.1 hypothetical protein CXF82_05145 [Shewanella sp. GutDb-MelDb]PKG75033.1 hypothetical protein CXF86_08545 [Shewanella sp. GutCb]PKH54876.1 hypothetical protein CXF84_18765 [Shewanella sp. Bg11-22]PKI26648.1 hypothetical protein CXF83_07785 [Shewanella sp. Choline-02u-19]
MLWFIVALTVASIMFLLTPEKVVERTESTTSFLDKFSQHSLLVLPVTILTWMVVAIMSAPVTPFAGTAIGFVLTSCAVALPQLHKYLAVIASLTFGALLIELALYL